MESSAGSSDTNGTIFNQIGELMTDADFTSSNTEFFTKNCMLFDENVEENKHEYK